MLGDENKETVMGIQWNPFDDDKPILSPIHIHIITIPIDNEITEEGPEITKINVVNVISDKLLDLIKSMLKPSKVVQRKMANV